MVDVKQVVSATEIFKCCPQGYGLSATNELDSLPLYECAEIAPNSTYGNKPIFGLNFAVDGELNFTNDNHIPECTTRLKLFELDAYNGRSQIVAGGCVDRLVVNDDGNISSSDALFGLECDDELPSSDRSEIEVHQLFKCCPSGWSFEPTKRECIANYLSLLMFNGLAAAGDSNSVLIFTTRKPQCRDGGEDVFVEYYTDKHRIQLVGSGIDVVSLRTGDTDFLEPNSFCIEGIVTAAFLAAHAEFEPSDVVGTSVPPPPLPSDEMRHLDDRRPQYIVRSCRPRSICHRMPCVRRCCRNDQMLERRNNTSVCTAHHRDIRPIFHDVDLPIEQDKEQKIVEPPGKL